MKIYLLFYMCHLLWALHIVIKQQFFYSYQLCKAHAKINTQIENSTPCEIVTHEDFNLKLGTRDHVADATHHATLGSNRPSGGSPQIGDIIPM